MATRKEIISMLEDAECKKLHDPNGHLRYRMPNGKVFYAASTPSDSRSYANALAFVRRELRVTHPDISNRGRNLPKNKRTTSNTIADITALKGIIVVQPLKPLTAAIAIPGAIPVEASFQLLDNEIEHRRETPEPEILIHRPPRMRKEPKPKSGPTRHLSPEQLAEANRILVTQGDDAMNAYLKHCSLEIIAVLPKPIPVPTTNLVVMRETVERAPSINRKDKQMTSVLDRARAELTATTERIATYTVQLSEIREKQDADVLKQTQLEQYIGKHEALELEAASLLSEVLPPIQKVKALKAPPAVKTTRSYNRVTNGRKYSYGIVEIAAKIYPILRAKGLKTFSSLDVRMGLEEANFPQPLAKRGEISGWLNSSCSNRKSEIELASGGMFRFKAADKQRQA